MILFSFFVALLTMLNLPCEAKTVTAKHADLSKLYQLNTYKSNTPLRQIQPGVYTPHGPFIVDAKNPVDIPSKDPFFQISYKNEASTSKKKIFVYFSPSCSHCYQHIKDGTFSRLIKKARAGEYELSFRVVEMTAIDPYIVSITMGHGEKHFLRKMYHFLRTMDKKNLWQFFQTQSPQKKEEIIEQFESNLTSNQLVRITSKDPAVKLLQSVAVYVGLNPEDTSKSQDYLQYIKNSRNPQIPIKAIPTAFTSDGKEVNIKELAHAAPAA